MKTLQMEDINWSAGATQYVGGSYCAVCRERYAAFVSLHVRTGLMFANLPCWHVGDSPGTEVAPDVRVRLLLVAEYEA